VRRRIAARGLHKWQSADTPTGTQWSTAMNTERHAYTEPQHLPPLYFAALRESQTLARQILQRLEALYQQFPDPSLHNAIELLRNGDSSPREDPA